MVAVADARLTASWSGHSPKRTEFSFRQVRRSLIRLDQESGGIWADIDDPVGLRPSPRVTPRLQRAFGDADVLAVELLPRLAHAVHTEVLMPYTMDLRTQLHVSLGSCRQATR